MRKTIVILDTGSEARAIFTAQLLEILAAGLVDHVSAGRVTLVICEDGSIHEETEGGPRLVYAPAGRSTKQMRLV